LFVCMFVCMYVCMYVCMHAIQDMGVGCIVEKCPGSDDEGEGGLPDPAPHAGAGGVDWESGILPKKKRQKRAAPRDPEKVTEAIMDATAEAIFGEISAADLLGPDWQHAVDEAEKELSDRDCESEASEDARCLDEESEAEDQKAEGLAAPAAPSASASSSTRSSTGAASSSTCAPSSSSTRGPAPPEQLHALSPATCLDGWTAADSRATIFSTLPGFSLSPGWVVLQTDSEPHRQLGKIRTISGRSFKCDCKVHPGCKFHLNISNKWEAAEACVIRWAIVGSAMATAQAHEEAGKQAAIRFKASLQ